MSRNSKSVSFEEYLQKPWRHNAFSGVFADRGGGGDYDRGIPPTPKAFHDSSPGLTSLYSRLEDSAPQLPPPWESKECLLSSVGPKPSDFVPIPDWWKSSVSKVPPAINSSQESSAKRNYLMPSSQRLSALSKSSLYSYLPPPTPYKDDYPGLSESYHRAIGRSRISDKKENAYEIIEIKSPRRVHFENSDLGLAAPSERSSLIGKISKALEYHEQKPTSKCEVSNRYGRPELFNFPDVYSPPPLPPLHRVPVRPASTLPPTQLSRVMPSFVVKTFNSQDQLHAAPRICVSEPIFKSENPQHPLFSSSSAPSVNVEGITNRFPIIITPRKVDLTEKNYQANNTPIQGKSMSNHFTGDAVGNRSLLYEHCSDSHLLGNSTPEFVSVPVGNDNFYPSKEGVEQQLSNRQLGQLSKHNCLSPRAKNSSLVQPTSITPAMADSLLHDCINNLKSPHWEDTFDAFSQIYNITEIHPTNVKSMLNKIIWHGMPHLHSSRSKLARMACICFKRLFQTQKRWMELEGEKVFYRLLDVSGSLSNNFLQQESKDALIAAAENMDALRCVSFLELHGAKHKNPHVREFSAYLLTVIMDRIPPSRVLNTDFGPKIIPMIVGFIREGLLQTRLHGKLALDKIFDQPSFDSKLRRYVSPENVRHISETLREFRDRRSGQI